MLGSNFKVSFLRYPSSTPKVYLKDAWTILNIVFAKLKYNKINQSIILKFLDNDDTNVLAILEFKSKNNDTKMAPKLSLLTVQF